jgi:hypothetical protein
MVTTFTSNGVNELSALTTNQKLTDYLSSYITSSNTSSGSPYQTTKIYLPFSSFGLNAGLHFSFGSGSVPTTATAAPK